MLAVPLVVAACGSGGSGTTGTTGTTAPTSTNATAAVNRAIARGAKQSARADFTGVVTTAGEVVRMKGSGDVDPKARRGTMHVTMSLASQQIPFDEVLDGSTAYVSSAFFSSFLPSGKKWLKVDLSSAGNLGAAGFALTSQPGAVPPLKDVRRIGTATVGGTQTTEYAAEVDRSKLSPAETSALAGTHATFGAVDVWVGTDGYVHRVRLDTSSRTGSTKANIVLTSTMSDNGEKVSVSIPPASQTVDASDVGIPGFSS